MVAELVDPILQSLLLGSLYTMMAVGLTMTYAVTRVPNFAHAEFITVGAYTSVAVVNILGRGPVESFVLAFLASAGVALASDELVFRPLFRRGATPLHLLVASIGLGLVIRYVLSIVVGSYDFLVVKSRIIKEILFSVGGAPFTNLHAWAIPTTVALVLVLYLLFTGTRLGKAMRAMASNFDLARVAGIKTTQVRRFTWLLAGGLGGLGGAFWSVNVPITPETGWGILLWLFAASILGGFVSYWGTITGGYVVGFAENLGISALHKTFGVSLSYRPMIALVIIVLVFLIRPQGFTGVTMGGFGKIARQWFARMRASLGRG